MAKNKQKEINFLYMDQEQQQRESIDEMMKKKKAKEREKRIKENNKKQIEDKFDFETETVIQMTNKNKIEKDRKEQKEAIKLEQKRKKRNKRIKNILKVLLMLLIVIGGITFAMVSPIFNIKEIKVIDNEQISSDTVISLSELSSNQNIFRFNKLQVENNIKTNPYIENVEIHRKIPNTVEIKVTERVHSYSVSFMGKFAYVNTQGYMLEISEDSKGKIIIYGTSTNEEEITLGSRLNSEDLNKFSDVIKITDIAKENGLLEKITSIDISNKNDYIIYMENEQKSVHLGDNTNLSNKMLYVLAILEKEQGHAGDIFVNGDLNNKFQPYFREKLS